MAERPLAAADELFPLQRGRLMIFDEFFKKAAGPTSEIRPVIGA